MGYAQVSSNPPQRGHTISAARCGAGSGDGGRGATAGRSELGHQRTCSEANGARAVHAHHITSASHQQAGANALPASLGSHACDG